MINSTAKNRRSAPRRALVAALTIAIAALATSCGSSKNDASSSTTASTAGSTAGTTGGTGSTASTGNVGNNSTAVQTLLKQGLSQAQSKMLDQAVTTFKNVLLLDPKNVYALYNLGVIDQSKNDTAGAVSYYNKAISADGTYTPAMYNKAIILEATDLATALALYKQIVTINPYASTAYLHMAFVYAKQGQTAKADQARAKAIALDASLSKYPLPAKCSQPNC
jgi:tetratricopeptide (TPR) repeat protein